MCRFESGFVSETDLAAPATDGAIVVRDVFGAEGGELIRRALSLRYVGDDARWYGMGAANVLAGIKLADLRDGDPFDKNGAHMCAHLPRWATNEKSGQYS